MDDKKKLEEQATAKLANDINAVEEAEAEATSAILAIIELAGTHTTATETEQPEKEDQETKCMSSKSDIIIDSRKHVSFKDNKRVVDNAEKLNEAEKLDKVKDYVKEIESNTKKEEAQTADKAKKRKIDANKRQEKQSENQVEKESAKRKRSDIEDFNLDDIIIEELPETDDTQSIASELEESQEKRRDQLEKRSEDDLVISENQEIAERFKQIMEMFDNFTKNLESLEMSSVSDENVVVKELSPKNTVLDVVENVGDAKSRDEEVAEITSRMEDGNNDYIVEMEDLLRPETEQFELSQLQQHNIRELPKWRQGLQRSPLLSASVRSCKDIATSTQLESRSAKIASVSCQTSIFEQSSLSYDVTNSLEGASGPEPSMHSTPMNVVLPPRNYDQKSSETMHHLNNDCRVETYVVAPTSAATECKTPQLGQSIGTSISRQNLAKVTESPSVLELPVLTQPFSAERTFHTIHIDTTSSPSSSVMRRPPLGVRCWHVITDMFNAICLCLQVNKDCIFCIGFFIAFVVSASFLTAFFYRTLSMTPQFFQPMPATTLQLKGTPVRDVGFYYY